MSGAIYKCPFNLKQLDDCVQIEVDFSPKDSDECKNFIILKYFKGSIRQLEI